MTNYAELFIDGVIYNGLVGNKVAGRLKSMRQRPHNKSIHPTARASILEDGQASEGGFAEKG